CRFFDKGVVCYWLPHINGDVGKYVVKDILGLYRAYTGWAADKSDTDLMINWGIFSTKSSPLACQNISQYTGELNELPHDVSNSMDQPEGEVKLWALSSN
ncbi:hypothetical protein DSO57_1031746, partial [Entomophthora muscae]